MPGNGGMQMYRCLKQDQKMSCIPVMMVSSIDRQTFTHYQKTKGIRLGQELRVPEAFLEKPPEATDIILRIKKALGMDQEGSECENG